jgi:hypothetical protein
LRVGPQANRLDHRFSSTIIREQFSLGGKPIVISRCVAAGVVNLIGTIADRIVARSWRLFDPILGNG